MGDARSLRGHAGDRLRAQVFFFQATVRNILLLPGLHFALERIFQRPLHSAERSSHLLGRLCVGVQDEIGPRHGIIDEHKRLRLPRGRQRPDRGQRHFLAETSLAIPKKIRLRLSRDMVSVRESLRRLRNRDRAETARRSPTFSAVQPFKSQQLDAFADHASFPVPGLAATPSAEVVAVVPHPALLPIRHST